MWLAAARVLDDREIIVRPSVAVRVFSAVWSVPFLVVGILMLVGAVRDSSAAGSVFAVVWLSILLGIQIVNQSTRVSAVGDTLRVRNVFRDHVFDRAQVERFSMLESVVGRPSFGRALVVVLRNEHTIKLRASIRGPYGQKSLDAALVDLQRWAIGA